MGKRSETVVAMRISSEVRQAIIELPAPNISKELRSLIFSGALKRAEGNHARAVLLRAKVEEDPSDFDLVANLVIQLRQAKKYADLATLLSDEDEMDNVQELLDWKKEALVLS